MSSTSVLLYDGIEVAVVVLVVFSLDFFLAILFQNISERGTLALAANKQPNNDDFYQFHFFFDIVQYQ